MLQCSHAMAALPTHILLAFVGSFAAPFQVFLPACSSPVRHTCMAWQCAQHEIALQQHIADQEMSVSVGSPAAPERLVTPAAVPCCAQAESKASGAPRHAACRLVWAHAGSGCQSSAAATQQPCSLLLVLVGVLDSALVQPWRRLRDHTRLPQQPRHRCRRLRAHRQPVLYPLNVET